MWSEELYRQLPQNIQQRAPNKIAALSQAKDLNDLRAPTVNNQSFSAILQMLAVILI